MGSGVTAKTVRKIYVFSGIWSFCVFSFGTAYMSSAGSYWVLFIPDAKTPI